jgi:hypothetical protein
MICQFPYVRSCELTMMGRYRLVNAAAVSAQSCATGLSRKNSHVRQTRIVEGLCIRVVKMLWHGRGMERWPALLKTFRTDGRLTISVCRLGSCG